MRNGLMMGVMAAAMAAMPVGAAAATSADASATSASDGAIAVEAAAALSPNQFVWKDAVAAPQTVVEPLSIVVSIADQRAYVYRGGTMVAATSVSTGKDGKETPTGSYTILQKKEAHRSNLYNDAPMPFMQRLTWDGIAIHAGKNPGFPASHGCIRVPTAFAKRLFAATELGTTVTVIDEPLDPSLPPPPPPAPMDRTEVAAANLAQVGRMGR